MASPRVYRITFMSQGKVYELYAKSVGSADLFGFVEVANLVWSQKSSVLIDPSEDSLKHEFDGVKRFFGEGSLALALYIMLDRQFPVSESA